MTTGRNDKAKIVSSNASTKVKVAGKELTVAEAIEYKSFIQKKKELAHEMKRQLNQSNKIVSTLNEKLDEQITVSLNTIYGTDKGKVEDSTYQLVAEPQLNAKEAALFDPFKIADRIKLLEEEIENVETELDFTLSEINSSTFIQF